MIDSEQHRHFYSHPGISTPHLIMPFQSFTIPPHSACMHHTPHLSSLRHHYKAHHPSTRPSFSTDEWRWYIHILSTQVLPHTRPFFFVKSPKVTPSDDAFSVIRMPLCPIPKTRKYAKSASCHFPRRHRQPQGRVLCSLSSMLL